MSFNSELNDFTEKAGKNAEKIFRGTTINLFGRIIKRTPVVTGRLKGNWQIDVNKPPIGILSMDDNSPLKKINSESKFKIQRGVGKASLEDTIYMANNLPYAQLVENGNYSTQAPAGMVGVTAAEFERVIEREAGKVK